MPSKFKVNKSQLKGAIDLPPSKSQTIRSIYFASMAHGKSIISNYLNSPDVFAMCRAMEQIGATICIDKNKLIITGNNGIVKNPDDIINAGNSGQVLRFLAPLAGLQKQYMVITGDESIRHNRPVLPLLEALPKLGMTADALRGDGCAPLILKGPFTHYKTSLSGEDSQPVSGLLMALGFANGESKITVRNPGETPWIDLTLSWLDRFNISYNNSNYENYTITGNNKISGFEYQVPGDLSSLAYPLAAAILTHSEITINGINWSQPQGDIAIVEILQAMGANLVINKQERSITVKSTARLHGVEVNINHCIDSITILAVMACFANSPTLITGAAIARKKECDRISCITKELKKMGANITELPDGMIVHPSALKAAEVTSHYDHRIAMSLAVAALALAGETTIHNTVCVKKSYPNFKYAMQSIQADIL